MSHGTIDFDGDEWEVVDAGGRNGPALVLKAEQDDSRGVFDALELDNRQDVTVYDHKGDETTAQKLARRLVADSELDEE